jgi:PPP family 3-phenylpropionic acid transporter
MFGGALTQSSHGALNAFGSINWQSAGFSDATIGYYWATGVLGEIIVFLVLGRLVGRAKAGLILLLIGAVAAVLRFTSMSLHPGLAAGFVLQAMHGLTFGASHLGVISCFAALAPQGARGRAQGIYGSAAAFATVATTVASGEIYRIGGSMVFAAMVPLAFAGAILILIGLHLQRTQSQVVQPQSVGSGG